MAIQHAVLALLAGGPSHGYQLKGAFEAAVGPQWGPLNIGHLYQILDRLSRDELVVAERQPQPIKPDRVVYEITPAGRAELARWLAEPSPRSGGFRDDFFLKVTAAARSGSAATVRAVLQQPARAPAARAAQSGRPAAGRRGPGGRVAAHRGEPARDGRPVVRGRRRVGAARRRGPTADPTRDSAGGSVGDRPGIDRLRAGQRLGPRARSRVTASVSTSGRLQNANRTSRRPASTSS